MFCENCGAEIPEGETLCERCKGTIEPEKKNVKGFVLSLIGMIVGIYSVVEVFSMMVVKGVWNFLLDTVQELGEDFDLSSIDIDSIMDFGMFEIYLICLAGLALSIVGLCIHNKVTDEGKKKKAKAFAIVGIVTSAVSFLVSVVL